MESCALLSHRLPPYLETPQANVMTSKLLICSRRSDGRSSARSQNTFAFKDSLSRAIHITFCSCQFVIDAQTKRFIVHRYKVSFSSQHTDTVKFEIPYGQENSFTAETDLIQRSLASTLKWPYYKFTSSETHRPIDKVHIYTSCFIPILLVYASVSVSLIPPMFRETCQTNSVTCQLLPRARPHLRSKIR